MTLICGCKTRWRCKKAPRGIFAVSSAKGVVVQCEDMYVKPL